MPAEFRYSDLLPLGPDDTEYRLICDRGVRRQRLGDQDFLMVDATVLTELAAGGVLPMCQDTGTAIVLGRKDEGVLTGADDAEYLSHGIYDAYTRLNLRYSQLAPLAGRPTRAFCISRRKQC